MPSTICAGCGARPTAASRLSIGSPQRGTRISNEISLFGNLPETIEHHRARLPNGSDRLAVRLDRPVHSAKIRSEHGKI
jgi:hypothetical protein